jgi:hypothetical protein
MHAVEMEKVTLPWTPKESMTRAQSRFVRSVDLSMRLKIGQGARVAGKGVWRSPPEAEASVGSLLSFESNPRSEAVRGSQGEEEEAQSAALQCAAVARHGKG